MHLHRTLTVVLVLAAGFATGFATNVGAEENPPDQSVPKAPSPPSIAQVDCSRARDPARCEVQQAALATCSHERGKRKTACLAEHMPPIDCSKAANPSRCEAIERAKQTCAGKSGKEEKACLKGEKQKNKAKKANKTSKKKKAVKKQARKQTKG
jgi:hypothetical protein